jgi:hypothetical protein
VEREPWRAAKINFVNSRVRRPYVIMAARSYWSTNRGLDPWQ